MKSIILIGFMGAGKTTISKQVAEILDCQRVDMDDVLVERIGSISEYFEKYGEASFRQHETALLKEAVHQKSVIATGGGVIMQEENQKVLSDKMVVYLKADPEILIDRIRKDKENIRPNATHKKDSEIKNLFYAREKMYEKLARLTVDTSNRCPKEIAAEIIQHVAS
ncbi:shikimate kinase [Enterococcus florum]|uniref:Shikimate kinase n=1 Tax=Enterococcus florum TaxID=2480627 RepID=A0A4P5PBH1_9ENTE|nr:shikimate kinase [Enterococcus florum]GCF95535.1 shikimate kinase [Enterococcus florum]